MLLVPIRSFFDKGRYDMIDREFGEEINHLTRAMQFLNCAKAFEKTRECEPVSDHQHILMVKFSVFLLHAWAYQHHRGLMRLYRFTAIPFDEAVRAWSGVGEIYEEHPTRSVVGKSNREYWRFINNMRRVAIAIGFQRVPQCSADELLLMQRWCVRMGEREFALSRRGGCYG